jgi:hypothetical protein
LLLPQQSARQSAVSSSLLLPQQSARQSAVSSSSLLLPQQLQGQSAIPRPDNPLLRGLYTGFYQRMQNRTSNSPPTFGGRRQTWKCKGKGKEKTKKSKHQTYKKLKA